MAAATTPRVRVLTTGGTIASTRDDATGAMRPATSGVQLFAAVPGLEELATVEVDEVALISSWDITLPFMAELARRVEAAAGDGVAGVVITHGTDTIEETAFALDLLVDADIPVVVTGAMRGGTGPDIDGPRNLLSAVRVAADPSARGLGAVVVLADEVHAGRFVHKQSTTALHTFASLDTGPLGTVDDGGVLLRWRPPAHPPLRDASGQVPDPAEPVELVWVAAGASPRVLEAAAYGAAGVVVAGSGSGNVPSSWAAPIRAAVTAGTPVVLASRCEAGRVVATYGGDGGGATLVEAGVIPAGDLSAVKARIALAFALGGGRDLDGLRDLFAQFG